MLKDASILRPSVEVHLLRQCFTVVEVVFDLADRNGITKESGSLQVREYGQVMLIQLFRQERHLSVVVLNHIDHLLHDLKAIQLVLHLLKLIHKLLNFRLISTLKSLGHFKELFLGLLVDLVDLLDSLTFFEFLSLGLI